MLARYLSLQARAFAWRPAKGLSYSYNLFPSKGGVHIHQIALELAARILCPGTGSVSIDTRSLPFFLQGPGLGKRLSPFPVERARTDVCVSVCRNSVRRIAVRTAGWPWREQRPAAFPHISVARPQGPGTTEAPEAAKLRPPHNSARSSQVWCPANLPCNQQGRWAPYGCPTCLPRQQAGPNGGSS